VLYLSTVSSPRTLRMARIAADRGYQVTVGAWDRGGAGPTKPSVRGVRFTIMKLRSPYGARTLFFMPVWFVFALLRALFGGFSVIQARNLDGVVPAILASKVTGSKVVYDVADYYADTYASNLGFLTRLSSLIEPALLRRADALVMASEGQLRQIGKGNLPERRMVFYNMPMDLQARGRLPKKDGPAGMTTLFYGGMMSGERFDALRNVVEAVQGLPVKILVAGFGEHAKLFTQLERAGTMELLGSLTHAEILEQTRRADAILLPYFPDNPNSSIGLANKFFDAMSTGTVMLVPRETLMAEIAEREGIGLLTDYRDVREIRLSVDALLGMGESDRAAMGERERALFRTRFNPDDVKRKYVEMLDSVQTRERP